MRQFVKMATFMPEICRFPFVGAAEMAGCLMFDLLGQAGSELFADERLVAERIRLLYDEILTDEIGHVGYCAARCSTGGRAVMRGLFPLFARLFARQTPEILTVINRQKFASRLSGGFDLADIKARLTTRTYVAAQP